MKLSKTLILILLAAVSGTFSMNANAQSWVKSDHVKGRMLLSSAADDGGLRQGVIEIMLDQDWHTYWRTPGESGLAPSFDWLSLEENADPPTVFFSAPQRFDEMGLQTFGYSDYVTFPFETKADLTNNDKRPDAIVNLLICKEICIPQSLELFAESVVDDKLVRQAFESLPLQQNVPGLKIETVVAGPDAIVVTVFSSNRFENADLFVESGDLVFAAKPQIEHDVQDPRNARITIKAPDGVENLYTAMQGKRLVLTLVDGNRALEKTLDY